MNTKLFEASVRKEDNAAVVDLHGEINALAEEALNSSYNEAIDQGSTKIILNFEGVDYINSTGIALIVGLMAEARKSSRHLLTYGLSDHYVEIFRITRLSDFIGIFPDERSALKEAEGNS